LYEETIRIISNTLIQNPIYKQTGATNLINQKHHIITKHVFLWTTKRGRGSQNLESPCVHAQNVNLGVDLVLALRRSKEHLPLLANNIPATTLTQFLF